MSLYINLITFSHCAGYSMFHANAFGLYCMSLCTSLMYCILVQPLRIHRNIGFVIWYGASQSIRINQWTQKRQQGKTLNFVDLKPNHFIEWLILCYTYILYRLCKNFAKMQFFSSKYQKSSFPLKLYIQNTLT